ncbi:hypothetical protein CYY_003808 [Polysphondylium violaceum]|uniref:Adenylyl cyclase-associated protein n=1 Tax=Polysphondylium violaceum TaxID=133409 RepID=A0A8J4PZ60_9MYCE|nr:hypothetical protein CYY_003808 [Polysphondylium violaceum]
MSLENTVADLLKRLEQATTRLETVEKALASGVSSTPSAGAGAAAGPSSAAVKEFQNLVADHIVSFVELSKQIAPEVGQQAEELKKAIDAESQLIAIAAASKKPTQDVLMKLIQGINTHAEQVSSIRDSHRSSKFFNNLSAVSEGIGFLSWVVVEPTPGPHVVEMRGSAEFYTNRILKEFKGVNQQQVDWVTKFIGFLKDLEKYIKQYHTTGLTWNPKGGDAASATPAAAPAASAPAAPSGAPAPPPPPPAGFNDDKPKKPAADMSAVFSALGKGEGVTSGLKKVTDDMKSKNNPNKSSVVKASDVKAPTATTTKAAAAPAKPPKFALEANKWTVEYQKGNKNIVIEDTDPKQTVYIYQCQDSVVQIKGKVNAITLDGCKKTAVVFENCIASADVVNCSSVEIQVTGKVPCMAIDKTSGCQVYLSKESLETEIVTSKSSEMNILIPGATPNDDMVEISVPEQFKTVVKGTKLVTEAVSHI